MTIIGKVRNINQMEARKDFFISSRVITFSSEKEIWVIGLSVISVQQLGKTRPASSK
jgi:hypothetical protein